MSRRRSSSWAWRAIERMAHGESLIPIRHPPSEIPPSQQIGKRSSHKDQERHMRSTFLRCSLVALCVALASMARADVVLFDTGAPDGSMAMATRPDAGGKAEIEAADDFIAASSFSV